MIRLRVFVLRLLDFFVGRRRERRLAEEIDAHLDMLTDDHVRRGMAREQARAAARREFGGVDQVRAVYRDERRLPFFDALQQDVRFAARLLAKDRGFTTVATLALALGIGVNNTFFTIVNASVLRGLPIERADRVMFLATRDAQDRPGAMSYRDFEAARASARGFEGLAAFAGAPVTIADEGVAPDRVLGSYISTGAFRLLGEGPAMGRGLLSSDDRPGAPAVAVVSSSLWRSRYGADSSIVGRAISINGIPSIVVGVMSDGFSFPNNVDLWQPLAQKPGIDGVQRDTRQLGVFGRLNEEGTLAQARAELATIATRLSTDRSRTNRGITFTVVPINEQFNGRITDRVWLAFVTAGTLVLLIACANVANLLLMRSTARAHEMAIRTSIGATRGRLVRQLLVESALLALAGGALGLAFSQGGIGLLSRLIPDGALPPWMELRMDARVFVVLACVCLGSLFVFGLVPALQVSRTGTSDVLKDGGRTGTRGLRARRWTTTFLAAEFALTLVLLSGVGLGVRQLAALQRAELAIDPRPLLTMWLTLPEEDYRTSDARAGFYDRLQERLDAIGRVSSSTLASVLPLGGAPLQRLTIEGRPATTSEQPTVRTLTIAPRYFATLGFAVRRGRAFTAGDGAPSARAAIVNERFVDLYLRNENALGRRIRLGPDEARNWITIVGVSPTVQQRAAPEPDPIVYLPYRAAAPATVAIIVRTGNDPGALASTVHEEVRRLDPNVPLYRVMTMERAMRESSWVGRMSSTLFHSIAAIALVLALVGLYAVTAHAVAERTQEIGIRIALGARPGQVRWLVLRHALIQLGIGLAVGIVCTFVWGKLFEDGSSRARLTDAFVLVPVCALLVGVAIVACLSPAGRAARLDPVKALRN